MKGKYSIMACVMALGAAGTTMWALSRPTGKLLKPTLLQHRQVATLHKASVRATETASADASMYWTVAKSYYHDAELDKENGDIRQFGTRVEIDGDVATIYGLVDLYFDEVDKEYAVQGKYNDRTGTITIEGTQYDSEKPVSSFIKLADMYSTTNDEAYTIVLFAGDMYGEQLETIDQLVFKVTEDLSTLTSETGYGAYAFSASGNPMAFYDYYQPKVKMTLATPEAGLAVSTENLSFNGLFIAANMPVKETIYIYNRSSEEATFSLSSSSSELTTSVSEGKIAPCSTRAVDVTLVSSQPGQFEGSLNLTSSAAEPIIISANVEVWETPDYAKITKASSVPIEFDMSPQYPFVISEFDGHIAAKSTNNGKGDNTQSFFVCQLNVPQGKTGVFSWDAAQLTSQPNTLMVLLDDEPIKYDYYVQTSEPVDMSGIVALASGKHEIAFVQYISMDWTIYGNDSFGYVWGLDFQLMDTQANLAYLENETADFGTTFYDGLSVTVTSEVTLLNVGSAALKVTEVKGNGNFSGRVPSISVPQGGEITVPLTWTAAAIGEDTGDVTIVTTAGEFTVKCKGMANELPCDYSKFVTEGEISFNTDSAWPFVISDNGKYTYNSTSKADIDGITESWLEAIFEVPEGKVGTIYWDAINSSEDLFVFLEQPSLISGTRFTIDGGLETMVGGDNVACASSDLYTPEQLTFKPGRHNVRFTYKKTANEPNYVFGDDRLKLFEIALKLQNVDEHKGAISTEKAAYPNPVYVGCAGHYPVLITNYTSEVPELLSSQCDAPFTAKTVNVKDGNLNLMIEFKPAIAGEYEGELTISTNIGDFNVSCKGSAVESELGTAIFYESFEYAFEENWVIDDANNDENSWERLSNNIAAYGNMGLAPYDGSEGLFLKGFDRNTFESFETDEYAFTKEITIPADGITTLRFMLLTHSYSEQYLEILAGEGDDVSNYNVIEKMTFDEPLNNWEVRQVNLSAMAGKKIRIAFRGYGIVNYIALDDVLVATTGMVSVNQVNADKEIVAKEYYTLSGERVAQPVKGVNVVVTRYSDGTSKSAKHIIK